MEQWSKADITHLLMRTGFGMTQEDADAAAKIGKVETVRRLVAGQSLTGFSPNLPTALEAFSRIEKNADGKLGPMIGPAQTQWLYRMIHTDAPLIEKMTLYLHDHFSTNARKIDNAELMVIQNELFRVHATGSFMELVKKIGRDPAMLIWLDASSNVAGKPNENYARELMELFTLGIGNYTEADIKEVARAFTGWKADKKTGKTEFRPKLHDSGRKQVLGESGAFKDTDVVDVIFRQTASNQYIVTKLLQAFATPEPSEEWVDRLSSRFAERHSLGDVLEDMLLSPEFWVPELRQKLVKTPAEYVAWITKLFDRPIDGKAISEMRKMGQDLYFPPDVNGWPNGEEWLSSANLLARYRYAEAVAFQAVKDRKVPSRLEKPSQASSSGVERWIDDWAAYIHTPISADTRRALLAYVDDGGGASAAVSPKSNPTLLRGLIQLLLVSPEAQLK